jgi:hypothetical protein
MAKKYKTSFTAVENKKCQEQALFVQRKNIMQTTYSVYTRAFKRMVKATIFKLHQL